MRHKVYTPILSFVTQNARIFFPLFSLSLSLSGELAPNLERHFSDAFFLVVVVTHKRARHVVAERRRQQRPPPPKRRRRATTQKDTTTTCENENENDEANVQHRIAFSAHDAAREMR